MDYTLDTKEAKNDDQALASLLVSQWKEARLYHAPVHTQAKRDRAFYDGDQFTDEEKAQLKRLGMPAVVINLISKAIDNICGRERASRYDWEAKPVGAEDVDFADYVTMILDFMEHQTEADHVISDAFEDAAKGPMGWLHPTYDESEAGEEPTKLEATDPFEMFFDPHSRRRGLEDARYIIRRRHVDLDLAIAEYGKEDALRAAIVKHDLDQKELIGDDYGNRDDGTYDPGYEGWYEKGEDGRERVELREHHWWKHEKITMVTFPDGREYEFNPADPQSIQNLLMGGTLTEKRIKRFYYAVMAGPVLLLKDKNPLPFAKYEYIPVWCKRDRKGRPHGLITIMVAAQIERNVARARLNESLRSRHLIVAAGALGPLTVDEVAKRLGRANFVLEVENPQGVVIGSDKADSALWMGMQDKAEAEIDATVGNNETAYGDKDSTAKSGVAKQMQVMQQSLNLGKVFDNLKWSRRRLGEFFLAMAQAFMPMEKWARIIEAESLQQKKPVDLSFLQAPTFNRVVQARYDLHITDQADTESQRMARFQQGVELAPFVPEGPLRVLYMANILRMSDWPDADETATMMEQFAKMMMQPPPMPGLPPGAPQNPEEGAPMVPDGMIPDNMPAQMGPTEMMPPPIAPGGMM